MTQSFDLGNTNIITFNNSQVEKLQLNGNTIWESSYVLVLNVTRGSVGEAIIDDVTYASDDNNLVSLVISSGDGGATATYGNITKQIPANTTVDCLWGKYKGVDDGTPVSGEVYIQGNISRLEMWSCKTTSNSGGVYNQCVTGVSQWSSGEQFVNTNSMFYQQSTLNGDVVVPEGIKSLDAYMFYQVGSSLKGGVSIKLPNSLHTMGSNCLSGSILAKDEDENILFPVIPKNVTGFGVGSLLTDTTSLGTSKSVIIKFLQPAGMSVSLPPAGDQYGIAYSKKSKNYTIYTDNEIIKNYDWGADNVVATFYHLDGTAWE